MNDSILRALRGEPTDRKPIWLMRQAGRYLPEYCATRAKAGSFLDLCRNAAAATEVTLQPLRRFPLDAAILFSDILTIPDAMGLGLYFVDGDGPRFAHPLRTEAAINRLPVPDPGAELRYVPDTVSAISKSLGGVVPLIGFSGSPFTLACYMVEGCGSKDFFELKRMMYRRPDLLHRILSTNAEAVTCYLNAQIEAGADIVQIFDTWGGILTGEQYRLFSLAYISRILCGIHRSYAGRRIPVILFTKGGGNRLAEMAATGVDGIGLDWQTDASVARRCAGNNICLQGNLDPSALLGTPELLAKEVNRVLCDFADSPHHIFNLGHGIDRRTDPEMVSELCRLVKGCSLPPTL